MLAALRCDGAISLGSSRGTPLGRFLNQAGAAPGNFFLAPTFWLGSVIAIALVAWRIRDRVQVRRQTALRFAVQNRTEQLERGQTIEASRNRILEMLVSNESLDTVLDAIARATRDQSPGALCIVLLKQPQSLKQNNDFCIGSALGVPASWLAALDLPGAVPFEIWRQRCEYPELRSEPAWRSLVNRLDGAPTETGMAGSIPVTIRSMPIGDSGASLGAILLLYAEPAGGEPWERILGLSARLAHIAIDHRKFCERLDYQAHHDSLTGLPNRMLLNERLESAIPEARSLDKRLAYFYIDVDEFKKVNDRFDHRAGDALLVELGRRLNAALRPGDTLARIGGDEFNILLPDIGDAAAVMEIAERLLDTVRRPFVIHGSELNVTLSIGIAAFPDDAQDAAELQREADAAMYRAKSLGKNRAQACADRFPAPNSVLTEQDLRQALDGKWFKLCYQPKFTAEGGLAGLEALIRLDHPRHGRIYPDHFISVAETTGLIVPIGVWVIDEACRQIAAWRKRGMAPVVVAVNVSGVQISRLDFARSVEECLVRHAVPACCLELEVTETMLIQAESEEHRQMQLLRAMGVLISIDDFGTGFSSLSYLHRLKIDAVKLDRSFVQTIDLDDGAQYVVRAIIGVAQGLGLDVIAEGVETEAQRVRLIAAGCPVMQGYLFAHPGPPEAIEPLLSGARRNANAPTGDLERLYDSLEAASRGVETSTSSVSA